MSLERTDDDTEYVEKVKTGLLLNNLGIKSAQEIFPHGMPPQPILLPMKPKMPKPETFFEEVYSKARSVCRMWNDCARTGALRQSFGLNLNYVAISIDRYFVSLRRIFCLTIDVLAKWFRKLLKKSQLFFKTMQQQMGHHFHLYSTLQSTTPVALSKLAWKEVKIAIGSVNRSYERICERILKKHCLIRHDSASIRVPICFHEEQRVARCFKEVTRSAESVMKCLDPLDLYRKCVDSRAENVRF